MFSEIVDDLMLRAQRTDTASRANLVAYLNATARELQQTGKYFRDRVEFEIDLEGNNSDSFIWDRPRDFRTFQAVRYLPCDNWIDPRAPGVAQTDQTQYYYGGPNYYTFVGIGGQHTIQLAYYTFIRRMIYYDPDMRPAKYDRETGTWEYLNANGNFVQFLNDASAMEFARQKVGHWILEDYKETVEEGTLAKFFKIYDNNRAAASFAVYRDLKLKFTTDEHDESTVGRNG